MGAGQYVHIKVDDLDACYEAVMAQGMKPDITGRITHTHQLASLATDT
jgi:hypothetical protein